MMESAVMARKARHAEEMLPLLKRHEIQVLLLPTSRSPSRTALQNDFDALFTTAAQLIEELSAASRDGKLHDALARYVKPHVQVVDEVRRTIDQDKASA